MYQQKSSHHVQFLKYGGRGTDKQMNGWTDRLNERMEKVTYRGGAPP